MNKGPTTKRITIPDALYNDAILIGKDAAGDLKGKAAVAGVEIAIKHYAETKEIDRDEFFKMKYSTQIDPSYVNAINAIDAIAKNKNISPSDAKAMIDNALLGVLSKIIEGASSC